MSDTSKKVALITGGTKGIGYGIAESLLKQGYQVAITSRTQDHADSAAGKLKNADVLAIEADVKDLASQKKAVEQVLQKFMAPVPDRIMNRSHISHRSGQAYMLIEIEFMTKKKPSRDVEFSFHDRPVEPKPILLRLKLFDQIGPIGKTVKKILSVLERHPID